jgi:hypothetical protein
VTEAMIERVALAISASVPNDTFAKDVGMSELSAMARAAIAAMREPTEAMISAGDQRLSDCWSLEHGEGFDEDPPMPVWQAMIDAALAPAASPNKEGKDA